MHAVLHAIGVFFDHLAAVRWEPLGIAVACQLVKQLVASRAWRNVVAAAYPEARVRWPSLYGALVAGAGVNAIVPIRGGDVVKLYIVKRRVAGSTYPTLASTILVLTLFDMVLAGGLLVWAIVLGVLPGLNVLPDLPSFDFGWFLRNPRLGAFVAVVTLLLLAIAAATVVLQVEAFWARVRQGFAILGDPPRWLRRVVPWQLADWCLRIATIFFMLRAFGIPATVHNALLVQVSESLATVFPVSPNGIGTKQALLLYVLAGKASRTALLGYSVGMQIALTVVNAAVGLGAIALLLRTLHWRRAVEADSRAPGSG